MYVNPMVLFFLSVLVGLSGSNGRRLPVFQHSQKASPLASGLRLSSISSSVARHGPRASFSNTPPSYMKRMSGRSFTSNQRRHQPLATGTLGWPVIARQHWLPTMLASRRNNVQARVMDTTTAHEEASITPSKSDSPGALANWFGITSRAATKRVGVLSTALAGTAVFIGGWVTRRRFLEVRAKGRLASTAGVSAYPTGRDSRFPRWRLKLPLLVLAIILLCRAPAWASGAIGAAPVVSLKGSFAERVAAYKGSTGSLIGDLAVSTAGLLMFALCAGTETAITTLWPWKVREYAQREREESERTNKGKQVRGKWTALREDIQRFMQTILIGATLSSVISTAFITQTCGELFGASGLGIAAVAVSLVQLTACEILPKSVAVSKPYAFASTFLPIFYFTSQIVYPFSKVLIGVVNLGFRLVGLSVDVSKTPFISDEELDIMIKTAMKSGVVEKEEGMMISSVRKLDDKSVKEIMTPLVDIVAIDAEASIPKVARLMDETQYTRMPLYVERVDTIVGVVNTKTLLRCMAGPEREGIRAQDIAEAPYFIPETMSLSRALRTLKVQPLAICVDEYGGTTGLVTLEDVLEQIVGEIYDVSQEKDKLEQAQNKSAICCLSPGHFGMSGAVDIDDVSETLKIELPAGDYNSIGGFICCVLDQIAKVGDAVVVRTSRRVVRFVVVEADEIKVMNVEAVVRSANGDPLIDSESADGESVDDDDDDDDMGLATVLETLPEFVVNTEQGSTLSTPLTDESEDLADSEGAGT